ncbi:MAG: DEAD/DEAH box helicase [Verrucomicrobiales bacterium]
MKFHDLSLDERIVRAIDSCGFETATPIRASGSAGAGRARPRRLGADGDGEDGVAFVLPLLHRLLARPSEAPQGARGPRVLILTPTRELALQVDAEIHRFGKHCPLTGGNVIGGAPYPPQLRMLRAPLDLMVATPGRLIDHMSQGQSRLFPAGDARPGRGGPDTGHQVHRRGVRQIAKKQPAQRQTLLFSATLEGKVMALARELLNDPVQIKLAANNRRHESIAQRIHRADDERHKRLMLERVLGCETVKLPSRRLHRHQTARR